MRLVLHIEADWSPCNDFSGTMGPIAQFWIESSRVNLWGNEYLYCPDCGKVWAKVFQLVQDGLKSDEKFWYMASRCQNRILKYMVMQEILTTADTFNRQQMELLIHDYLCPYIDLARSNDGDLAAAFRAAGLGNPYFRSGPRQHRP